MKDIRVYLVYIIGTIFVLIILAIMVLAIQIGIRYRKGISDISDTPSEPVVIHTARDKITKITIENSEDQGCMEVTPDGAVRVYKTCGTEIETAQRLTDPKYILRLYNLVYENMVSAVTDSGSCNGKKMIIETTGSKKIVCLGDTSAGGASGNTDGYGSLIREIIKTIDLITGEIQPTPTPIPPNVPTATPYPTGQPTPTPTLFFVPIISPTPTNAGPLEYPFTCGFNPNGKKKPYIISNVICSTDPTPAP